MNVTTRKREVVKQRVELGPLDLLNFIRASGIEVPDDAFISVGAGEPTEITEFEPVVIYWEEINVST